MSYFDIDELNAQINLQYCKEIVQKLSFESMKYDYINSKSLTIKIKKINKMCKECNIDDDKAKCLINKMIQEELIIPTGLKSVLRGNKFNKIIEKHIIGIFEEYKKDVKENFVIRFEEKSKDVHTEERPDWTIYDKKGNKTMIGMNQLDLSSGGHQTNRGSKYIIERKDSNNSRLVCVICNHITIKTKRSKVYKLFNIGFKNDTLCYIKNLENIITKYFGL
jgi:hypothetical protein